MDLIQNATLLSVSSSHTVILLTVLGAVAVERVNMPTGRGQPAAGNGF